jgi:hypothetical protein
MSEQGTLTGRTDGGKTWTYTGGTLNGLRHGKGEIIWSDGTVLEGDWVDGEPHGKGTGKSTYSDGEFYVGEYVDGREHGKGKYTYSNGAVYEGDWVDGREHGKGKCTYKDGSVLEGDYVDGWLQGKGKLTLSNGDIYEGDFNDDLIPHGKGKLTKADGAIYEGDVVDGKRHGKGKLTAGGDVYEGDFVADKPHGKGTVTTANGEVYDADEYFAKNSDESSDKNFEVEREEKELKILLILSGIGFVLGAIIGANGGNVLFGMWVGIGIGGALSFIPFIPYMFKSNVIEHGFGEGIKIALGGLAVWLVIFILAGPIALLVRFLMKKHKIKKLQENG